MPLSLGVLASGAGSNLGALLDACGAGRIDAKVSVVLCNVAGAGALEKAAHAGVPSRLLAHRDFPSREAFEAAIEDELEAHGVELVVLAGFMRVLGPAFIRGRSARIVNVHPSLLPAFPGAHAVRQALDAGVKVTGCTVHLVDEGVDTGPVLAQAAVPVLESDDVPTLTARIQRQEHVLLPRAIGAIAAGMRVEGRRAILLGARASDADASLVSPALPFADAVVK